MEEESRLVQFLSDIVAVILLAFALMFALTWATLTIPGMLKKYYFTKRRLF